MILSGTCRVSSESLSVFRFTCQPEEVLDGEPHDADGFDHGQLRVVLRVPVFVHDRHRGDGVGRHAGRRQHHERDGDDAHELEVNQSVMDIGGLHRTEVAYLLLTQQPWV